MKSERFSFLLPASLLLTALIPLFAATSQGQNSEADRNDRGPKQLVCSLSLFLSFDSNDVIGNVAHIEGRGLTTCRNAQGFTTDAPVFADIDATVKGVVPSGESSFSINASTFVIPREIGQINDVFDTRDFSWTDRTKADPTLVFRGRRNDLVLETKLTSATTQLSQIEIQSMRLRFDESAPDFD
jgi:hypothetical protein